MAVDFCIRKPYTFWLVVELFKSKPQCYILVCFCTVFFNSLKSRIKASNSVDC